MTRFTIAESLALTCWLLISVCKRECDAAKILFSAAIDTGSHIGSMVPIINRVAEEGHDVTVFETSALKKARKFYLPNINVKFIQVPQDENMTEMFANLIFRREIRADSLSSPYAIDDMKTLAFMQDRVNVTTLRDIINTKWDLFIIDELFGVHSFAMAMNQKKFLGTPYIVYSTTAMIHTTIHSLALGRNYVSEPYLLTSLPHDDGDVYDASRLRNRLDNIYNILLDFLHVNYYVPKYYMRSAAALGLTKFSFSELFAQSSWIFADYATRMKYALTEGTEIRHVGAACRDAPPLIGELAHFVEDPSSHGTIYVAFGSYINWAHAPQALIDAYFDALDVFTEYRVIFTYNGPAPRRPPRAHILLTKWAPQIEVLAHPKTRVFVSHGGLKSWKESLCSALPVVYMPVFAEQSYNVKLALRMGYARALNKFQVGKHEIINALRTLLGEYAHFKNKALRARAFFLDRPLSALDEASHAIHRAIKSSKSPPHFARHALHQTSADTLYFYYAILLAFIVSVVC